MKEWRSFAFYLAVRQGILFVDYLGEHSSYRHSPSWAIPSWKAPPCLDFKGELVEMSKCWRKGFLFTNPLLLGPKLLASSKRASASALTTVGLYSSFSKITTTSPLPLKMGCDVGISTMVTPSVFSAILNGAFGLKGRATTTWKAGSFPFLFLLGLASISVS